VGASGWDYYVAYQPDLQAALDELRRHVFEIGDYWWAVPCEFGKSAAEFPDRPRTEAELWADESVQESGTHSILWRSFGRFLGVDLACSSRRRFQPARLGQQLVVRLDARQSRWLAGSRAICVLDRGLACSGVSSSGSAWSRMVRETLSSFAIALRDRSRGVELKRSTARMSRLRTSN
jgi:hypothetical protein